MKLLLSITLLVLGATVILGPVVARAYTLNRDKDRVAEYHQSHPLLGTTGYANLPPDLRPHGYGFYDYACLTSGVAMILMGLRSAISKSTGVAA